jgi:hypothetical protein
MKALALAAALLLPLAQASAEEAGPAPKAPEWKGTVGAGLIVLTGNSETTTFTGAAAASRETLGWIVSAKATGGYGQNAVTGGGPKQVTALNAGAQLRLDRKFGETWAVFALGGLETDHVASVAYRTIAEVGVGAQWLDLKEADWQRLALRTDLGLRYGYEARWRYYGAAPGAQPGVELLAPRLGVAFRYGFAKDVFFTEEAEIFPSLVGASRLQVKSVSRLSSRLTSSMTFGAGYTVAFDSAPAPGKERTDTILSALLEVGF